MDKYSWLTLRCKRRVFYRPICSAYGHCNICEVLSMDSFTYPYKLCPFWKETKKKMRLIDAHKLKGDLVKLPMMSNSGEAFMSCLIDEQPTVDPETLPIVSQLKSKNEVLLKLLSGKRVEAENLVAATGWSFEQCCKRFELNCIAEWWSVVGKTDEERSRNGQKITCYFCLPPAN